MSNSNDNTEKDKGNEDVAFVRDRTITVCDKCFTSSCWKGIFLCSESSNAGTVDKKESELRKLNLEHPSYFNGL